MEPILSKNKEAKLTKALENVPANHRAVILSYIQDLEESSSGSIESRQQDLIVKENSTVASNETTEASVSKPSLFSTWFSLPHGVGIYNFVEDQLIDINSEFLELFLFSSRQFDHQDFSRLFPEIQSDGSVTLEEVATISDHVVRTGQSEYIYLDLLKIDGTAFPCELTVIPCSVNNEVVILVFKDQTVLRQAKEELIKSEELYRDFIEYAPVGTIRIGLSGLVEFCSISAEKMFEYDRHEYINQPIIERIHEEDRAYFLSLIRYYPEKANRILDGEFRAIRKDGSIIWIKGSGQVKLDDNDRPVYFLASFLDVTESKQTKELFSEQETIYQALVANSREGIDIIDVTDYHPVDNPQAQLLIRNKRMASIFRDNNKPFVRPEDFDEIAATNQTKGRTTKEVFYSAAKRLFTKGFSQEIIRIEYADGVKMDIEAQEQILSVSGKKILIRFYKDITNRIRQEEQIEQQLLQMNEQNADLQTYIQSNMQLENFAYIASHDLRAPIRNIVSFSNLLERRMAGKLGESEQDFLSYIVESASNMSALIEDLLTFSRANTKKRKLSKFNFSAIVRQIEDELGIAVSNKGGQLIWPKRDLALTADRIKLYQILLNLIGNALKFTKNDRSPIITIDVKSSKKHWTFSVADNGIGVAAEFSQQIFLIFKRLHSQKDYEGTGIGLAICKKLVEQHNGRIWVESNEGKGSTFCFTMAKGLS